MGKVLRALAAEGVVTGWRDECYPLKTADDAAPLSKMERAGAAWARGDAGAFATLTHMS